MTLIELDLIDGARAAFTGRVEGNMSSVGGDGHEHGTQARNDLRESLGLERLARVYQVHGASVHIVSERPPPDEGRRPEHDADAQATALDGIGAMVLAADCVPIALGSSGGVAIAHAGWRGLAAGVIGQAVGALRTLVPGHAIAAAVGPCAGPCCYEVGPEVHAALGLGEPPGAANVDLRAVAHERLRAAGVDSIVDADACTICDERFFSHRREGERAGRQAGVAWLS